MPKKNTWLARQQAAAEVRATARAEIQRLRETKFGLELNEIERPPQSWFYVTEGGKINE